MENKRLCGRIVEDIRTGFILFPHVKRILSTLDRMYAYQCDNEEPEHIVLLGESGVGKSTLLKKYAEKHAPIHHEELTEVPVLYIELDESPTPKSIASTLLKRLGDPLWDKGDKKIMKERLIHLLNECRVRIVIIDEANHMVDRGGEKTLHNSADWLKGVVNKARVSFVLAGIPRTRRLFRTNDQLRDRFREIVEIGRFSVANTSAEHEFRSVLKVFKGYLRNLPTIDISGVFIARSFAFATDGRLRDIRALLVRAVELAYTLPDPAISDEVLAEAFRTVIYPGSPDNRNPFHKAFDKLPLVATGEPFEPSERTYE